MIVNMRCITTVVRIKKATVSNSQNVTDSSRGNKYLLKMKINLRTKVEICIFNIFLVQNNAFVKGDGGAVGLTENHACFRPWIYPEMARLIQDFEGSTAKRQDTDGRPHEHKRYAQMAFAQDVRSLSRTMLEMGTPFAEYSSDLLVLTSETLWTQQ